MCDGSGFAIGSVLSQGEGAEERPVAYYSRTLNKHERAYGIPEREMLSVVEGIKHFRVYLYGQEFTVVTDHSSLTYLRTLKDPEGKWQDGVCDCNHTTLQSNIGLELSTLTPTLLQESLLLNLTVGATIVHS